MAGPLPVLSGIEVRKAFENGGWQLARQRGSHMILIKEGSIVSLSIPAHKEVARGTLLEGHGLQIRATAGASRASTLWITNPLDGHGLQIRATVGNLDRDSGSI